MCHGISRIQTVYCLFFSVVRTSAERSVYCTAIFTEVAHNNCFIFSSETVFLNLLGKRDMRIVIFCNNKKTACVLIYSMNNSGTDNSVYA